MSAETHDTEVMDPAANCQIERDRYRAALEEIGDGLAEPRAAARNALGLETTTETKSVSIYRQLFEAATDAPRRELRSFVGDRVVRFANDLTEELVEHLRNAYTAGVADGYRQSVIEAAENEPAHHRSNDEC